VDIRQTCLGPGFPTSPQTRTGVPGIAPHDPRRTCAKRCRAAGGELEQIQLLLGHDSIQTTERYLGTKQDLVNAPNDGIKPRVPLIL
jgi:integrase